MMSNLVRELLEDLGTPECVAALPTPEVDTRDIVGDYDGMTFLQENDDYLKFIGQVGQ